MRFHLGLATTLSPAATGPAEFVTGLLPELARASEISCFVDDPRGVDPALRHNYVVRPLAQRRDPGIDILVYHIANNLTQAGVYDAAMQGPPGLLEIHDASLHHMLATRTIGSDDTKGYRDLLRTAHGPAGDDLARLRLHGHPSGIELFMFDILKDLLDRHLGVVVHNRSAADLIALRAPALPIWVIPHPARVPPASQEPASLGLQPGKLVIAHFGFVTPPKRPYLILEAFGRLRQAGSDAHLLFGGRDDTSGELRAAIQRLGLQDHVTVTGYLPRDRMDALISAADIVVSLRFPHVGESSGTLAAALGAGRPVVVEETGSWAELPEDTVLRIPAVGDQIAALTEALVYLATHPGERARLGDAARAHARQWLGAERYANSIVEAAKALAHSSRVPPSVQLAQRASAIEEFLARGDRRLTTGTLLHGVQSHPRPVAGAGSSTEASWTDQGTFLSQVPPGKAGAKLLDVTTDTASSRGLLRMLECIWGYQARGCEVAPAFFGEAGPPVPARSPLPHGHFDRAGSDGVLPYPGATYDVATCWDALPAGEAEAYRLLAEINRVLRPGGVLVVSSPASPDELDRLLDSGGFTTGGTRPSPPAPEGAAGGARSSPFVPTGASSGRVAVARKVNLPIPAWPDLARSRA